jgi:pimeloyl-ACP methyl ester carboxylesterase
MRPARPSLARPGPAIRLRAVSRDGTGLHVQVHEAGRADAPTVVLIHGWTCSASYWAPVIRLLRGGYRVVTYDQRGHGASDPPGPGGCSTAVLADDLAAVLETAVPGGSAVLAGHSMGGMTIMAAAARPEVRSRTSAVLLASTGCARLTADSLVFPLARAPRLAAAARRLLVSSAAPMGPVSPLSRAVLSYMTLGPAVPRELAAINAAMIHSCDRRARGAWGRVLVSLDVSHGLPHLDVPARVLVGSADRMTPPAHARLLGERLPRCEGVTVLPGVGHMTPLEAPATVAALVRKLASATEQGASGEHASELAG